MADKMVILYTPAPHILNNNGLELKWDRALRTHALVKANLVNVNKVVVNRLIEHGEIPLGIDYNEQFHMVHGILREAIVELFDEAPGRNDFALKEISDVVYVISGGAENEVLRNKTARLIKVFDAFGGGFFSRNL